MLLINVPDKSLYVDTECISKVRKQHFFAFSTLQLNIHSYVCVDMCMYPQHLRLEKDRGLCLMQKHQTQRVSCGNI